VGDAYLLFETSGPAFGFQVEGDNLVWAEPAEGETSEVFASALGAPDAKYHLGTVDGFMPTLGSETAYTLTRQGQLLEASLPEGSFAPTGIAMGGDFGQFRFTMTTDDFIHYYRGTALIRIDRQSGDVNILNMTPPEGFRAPHIEAAEGSHLLVRAWLDRTQNSSYFWFDVEQRSWSEVEQVLEDSSAIVSNRDGIQIGEQLYRDGVEVEPAEPSLTPPIQCTFQSFIACGTNSATDHVIASPVDIADSIDAIHANKWVVWRETWTDSGLHHGVFVASLIDI
jgi:hypothetical protein